MLGRGVSKRTDEDLGLPELAPVSDSSASSSDSILLDRSALHVPLEVGGESFKEQCCGTPKRVSFGDVEIRKYPVILGDHPNCEVGPPVTIDWEPFKAKSFQVEYYESKRGRRRTKDELQMGWIERKQLLRKGDDATDEEMRQAACEAQRIRSQREKTKKMLAFEFVHVPMESLNRKLKRFVNR